MRDITAAIRRLETFPYMGMEVSQITGIPTKYRYLFNRNNYVFYRIDKDNIYIIRILNEKQNYIPILFGVSETEE